jgi:transmembrane sensor
MSLLDRNVERAARSVDVDWSDARAAKVSRALARAQRRRALAKTATKAVALVACAAALVLAGARVLSPSKAGPGPVASQAPKTAPIEGDFSFADGSTITLASPDARLAVDGVHDARIDVTLTSGGARFDVKPSATRLVVVRVSSIVVEVAGAFFEIDQDDGHSDGHKANVRIHVTSGSVRVVDGDHVASIEAGATRVFGAENKADPAIDLDAGSSATDASAPRPDATAAPAAPSWRSLAREGDFDKAYDALSKEGLASVRDETAELLLAADVARLSKHAAQAVPLLRRVVDGHPGDARAPLAAFTLGRILLDQLGRPREAADMFARTRALGGGGLGEDALAREVEASSRAGDQERAHRLAEQYVTTYPNGQRKRSVAKFGGLE